MKGKQKSKPKSTKSILPTTNLQTLDELIRDHVKLLQNKPDRSAKLGDLLKMIELRYRLAPGDQAQQEFWAMLEDVRREILPHDNSETAKEGVPATPPEKAAKGKK